MNIILLFGGNSVERDVSVITAYQAYCNLDLKKYRVYPLYCQGNDMYYIDRFDMQSFSDFKDNRYTIAHIIDKGMFVVRRKRLKRIVDHIDCALLAMHGGDGEGGIIQGYLQQCGIPYTSCDVAASALCLNKYFTKIMVKELGVDVLDCIYIRQGEQTKIDKERIKEKLNSEKLIVKPNTLGSSIGIETCDINSIEAAMERSFEYDSSIIIESCIEKVEYNCAAFSYMGKIYVSDVERVDTQGSTYTFQEKYQRENMPSKICAETDLTKSVREITEKIYKEMGLCGVARVDYFYDEKESKLYFNEVNTIPGSLAFYLFKNQFDYTEMLDMLIDNAIRVNRQGNKVKRYKSDILSRNNYMCVK